jgi:hypothetical protein
MIENLKTAFSLARKQHYAAAVENEEKGGVKTKPDFKPGDMLFVWARNSEEARAETTTGRKIALPKKWINPWIGPYKLIKWVSERKCLLDCAGKHQEYIVNRLSKHNRWDEVNPSTYAWSLRKESSDKSKPKELRPQEKPRPNEKQIFEEGHLFQKDEIIVFEQQESEAYPIPFGMGVVLEHNKNELIKFQWMGNSTNNEKGKWEPCWFQENEAKIYYQQTPLHKKHPANTGEDTDTRVKPGDVIISSGGGMEILGQDKTKDHLYRKITASARKIIEANPYVIEGRARLEAAAQDKEQSSSNPKPKRKRDF